ncbi:Gde1 [Symbiodinium natans]|uniref:Gde1 protein n=1 Tax=Symbiodinium natans TaxID=878477 RepID=A0A812UCJ4_9DINO|nr:Gde1 [Symbiodinium natans]
MMGLLCSSCCGLMWLGGGIATLAVLYGSRAPPRQMCYGQFDPVIFLHRGNLTHGQENTLKSVVAGAAALGANPEIDVMSTSDKVAIIHHDDSFVRMTGVDKKVDATPWSEVQGLTVLAEVDGYDYGTTSRVPSLDETVTDACASNPTVVIDFDVKDDASAESSVAAWESSSCTAKSSSIFATGLPTTGRLMVNKLEEAGMTNHVSVYLHPGSYGPLGLYFFLKTGIFHAAAGASIISLHKTVWDVEMDLITAYEEMGYCTAIYGIRPEEMSLYPSASFYIIDEGPYFPDTPNGQYGGDGGTEIVTYDGDQSGFNGLLALGIICFPMLFLSWACCCCFCCRLKKSRAVPSQE